MSGAPTRRSTRSTRLVDQNAGQSAPTTRKREAPAAKKPNTRAGASKPTTAPPLATVAPTVAGRKRKALGDNTNAEKKKRQPVKTDKAKGKEKEPVKPPAKSAAVDTPGTSASTSMRLVVELPLRKRAVSQKPKVTTVETTKVVETTTVKTTKPVTRSASAKPAALEPKKKPIQPGNALEPVLESKPPPEPKPSHIIPPASAPGAKPDAPTTKVLEPPEPEPEATVDEPSPKRRRSNDHIAVPVDKPDVVEASLAVPSEENDNPFQAGIQSKPAAEAVGVGSARLWDDLDAGEADDPLMVSEYVIEIYDYLKELEVRTMPSSVYINSQPELDWKMRGILMDWMIQVHARFRLLPETLYIAANIVDRFLSLRVVSRVKLQMVGITALFIAAKYEEIMAPSVQNFLRVSDAPYQEQEIMTAEKYVLRTLDWNLSYPNPMGWLRRASKADSYDSHNRNLAKFLLEISVVEERLLKYTPSMLAAAALWLARLMLDRTEWDANLEHYSGYSEKQLIPCANVMLNYLFQSPSNHESLWKKYSGRKFSKFAVLARKWAEARWPPDSRRSSDGEKGDEEPAEVGVDLAAALPILREQIKSGTKASVSPEIAR